MIEKFFKVETEKKSRNLLTTIEKFFKVETEKNQENCLTMKNFQMGN